MEGVGGIREMESEGGGVMEGVGGTRRVRGMGCI